MISKLQKPGRTLPVIHCIEYLHDKPVLDRLPGGSRWLKRNVREDVILYLETMADMPEEKLLQQVQIQPPAFMQKQPEPTITLEKIMAGTAGLPFVMSNKWGRPTGSQFF